MAWTIDYSHSARRRLRKLDANTARRILDYMEKRVAAGDNPRQIGKALSGDWAGFWRYRVGGDYRVICQIQDNVLRVLVVEVGRRDQVYR